MKILLQLQIINNPRSMAPSSHFWERFNYSIKLKSYKYVKHKAKRQMGLTLPESFGSSPILEKYSHSQCVVELKGTTVTNI